MAKYLIHVNEPGVRHLRLALLIACGQIWLMTPRTGSYIGMTLWLLRFATLTMLLLARDKPVRFEDLEQTEGGAGMGLLVYRADLCRRLKALLDGQDLSEMPDMPRFKASSLRMQ
eukprot:scaffold194232_cov44-Prasinocladus_malaysianus.AAC.2